MGWHYDVSEMQRRRVPAVVMRYTYLGDRVTATAAALVTRARALYA